MYGDFRGNFHQFIPRGKAFGAESETVNPKGQILENVVAVGVDLEGPAELIGIANKFADRSECEALRIVDLNSQLAPCSLGVGGRDPQKGKDEGRKPAEAFLGEPGHVLQGRRATCVFRVFRSTREESHFHLRITR
jgi:hypothetical protein